jgi:hypothetical protein
MARLYVIGDKKTGVLFLKTDPLRTVIIPTKAIQAYAKTERITFEEAFGRVGSVAKFLTNKGSKTPKYPDSSPLFKAVGDLIAGGEMLSDADFCFVADLSAAASKGFDAKRFSSGRFSSGRFSSARFSSGRFSSARFTSGRFSSSPVVDALSLLSAPESPGDKIPQAEFTPRKSVGKKAPAKKARAKKARARKAPAKSPRT